MQIKKNPKSNLENYSKIFVQIGLVLAMFITYTLIEMKTYDKTYGDLGTVNMNAELEEEIPITERPEPVKPKTPPPPTPEKIEVVEDEKEIEETVIESTETDETEAVEVEEIEEVEEVEEVIEDVSFMIIEDVPVFPGCEKGTKSEKKACFQIKMEEHVAKHFKYPEQALDMGIQGKVFVVFVINKDGFVSDIRSRGPDRVLEKEAERIINLLPKMIPGKQRGKAVKVPYSVPIVFKFMSS